MTVILLVPLLVIATVVAVVLQRRHGTLEGYRFFRAVALGLAILFAGFAGLFIIGETAEDPGGAVAVGLIAAWLVPMAALVAGAWWWPRVTWAVLAALVAVVVAVGVWYAIDPDGWRVFEDDHGPIRAVAVFALSLPLAVLAWRRPVMGGALLVVLGVVPGVIALVAGGGGGIGGTSAAVASPAAVVGLLDLVAGWLQHRRPAGDAGSPPSPEPSTP